MGTGTNCSTGFHMAYTAQEFIRAWSRSIFGVIIGIMFWWIFDSLFLGFLTIAFFFFIPSQNSDSERRANRILFGGLMVILLFLAFSGSGLGLDILPAGVESNLNYLAPWTWSGSAIIFLGIWIISFLSGVLGGIQARQGVGIAMIIISFLMFTFGVGSNQVGSAAFGDWWPQVKSWSSNVFGPIKASLSNAWSSLQKAWGLFTDPFGAARDIIDGIYKNPTGKGKVGSYGVEIEELSISDSKLLLGKPFSISLNLKNQGATQADNLELNLYIDNTSGSVFGVSGLPLIYPKLEQEEIQPETFIGNVLCSAVRSRNLKLDYIIPIRAELDYQYSMQSSLNVEVISSEEWDRLIKAGKLPKKKVKSEMTSSPVSLVISLDMDQPIKENTRFFIGVEAKNKESDGIAENVVVEIDMPDEFVFTQQGITYVGDKPPQITQTGEIIWTIDRLDEEGERIFIDFTAGPGVSIDVAERTFTIDASADFDFKKWKEISKKFEFGGFCCTDVSGVCPANEQCVALPGGQDLGRCTAGGSTGQTTYLDLKGLPGFCQAQIDETSTLCDIGQGGCDTNSQCLGTPIPLECRDVGAQRGAKVCCSPGDTPEACLAQYNEWLNPTI